MKEAVEDHSRKPRSFSRRSSGRWIWSNQNAVTEIMSLHYNCVMFSTHLLQELCSAAVPQQTVQWFCPRLCCCRHGNTRKRTELLLCAVGASTPLQSTEVHLYCSHFGRSMRRTRTSGWSLPLWHASSSTTSPSGPTCCWAHWELLSMDPSTPSMLSCSAKFWGWGWPVEHRKCK